VEKTAVSAGGKAFCIPRGPAYARRPMGCAYNPSSKATYSYPCATMGAEPNGRIGSGLPARLLSQKARSVRPRAAATKDTRMRVCHCFARSSARTTQRLCATASLEAVPKRPPGALLALRQAVAHRPPGCQSPALPRSRRAPTPKPPARPLSPQKRNPPALRPYGAEGGAKEARR